MDTENETEGFTLDRETILVLRVYRAFVKADLKRRDKTWAKVDWTEVLSMDWMSAGPKTSGFSRDRWSVLQRLRNQHGPAILSSLDAICDAPLPPVADSEPSLPPVSNGPKNQPFLGVPRPTQPEIPVAIREGWFTPGSRTAHTDGRKGTVDAVLRSDRVPSGYVLRIDVDGGSTVTEDIVEWNRIRAQKGTAGPASPDPKATRPAAFVRAGAPGVRMVECSDNRNIATIFLHTEPNGPLVVEVRADHGDVRAEVPLNPDLKGIRMVLAILGSSVGDRGLVERVIRSCGRTERDQIQDALEGGESPGFDEAVAYLSDLAGVPRG